MRLEARYAWLRQLAALAVLLAVWEAADRANLLNPIYAPSPSRVGAALIGRLVGAGQSQDRGRFCLHRRLRGRVRGGNAGPGLSPLLCAEHLQRRADVRAHPSDPHRGASHLRLGRAAGKISPALELSAATRQASLLRARRVTR